MRPLQLFAMFILSVTAANGGPLLPAPRAVAEHPHQFKLTGSTRLVVSADSKAMRFITEQLNDRLTELGGDRLSLTDEATLRKLSSNYLYLGIAAEPFAKRFLKERGGVLTAAMRTEGYFLDVNADGCVIIAESEKGLFYGVMTLIQWMGKEKRSVVLRGVTITDFPLQKVRGITDDLSRGQISTMEDMKRIIRTVAGYKLNVYSPYIEDIFRFRNHPAIGKDRGALTAAEWKELDAYAKRYFVEVIPIFETLGHWENILILPEYAKYAEFPGAQTVNVSDERTYALLEEMIGEIASCFSSPFFNIAADESWDVGLGASKERVKKSDLATVHAEHYKRIFDIVKKYGKKPMMYGDIILQHPEILKKIPSDVTMVDWHYGATLDYPSPEVFKAAGFPYIVSPAVWNFTGPFPNYINTFLNIRSLNRDGFDNGSLGMLCSNWNDFGGEALRELNYYGYAWTAECAWNPVTADQPSFDRAFFSGFFGPEASVTMQSVYAAMSSPANQFHWYELWRHPMLPNRDDMIWEKRLPLLQRMQSIRSTMPLVLRQLEEAAPLVTANKEHLPYLAFVAKLNLWFADKIEAQERIRLWMKDTTLSAAVRAERIGEAARSVTEGLSAVKQEFVSVWKRAYRPKTLDLLLERYDRQAAYWTETAAKATAGATDLDPSLRSRWIYADNRSNGKDTLVVQKAFFRKTFTVGKHLRSAKLQLLGDTYAQLSVNGTPVGSVEARRSLSLYVERQRAKIFDILPLLNDSLNVITVETQNYQENGSAGMNVYAEFTDREGKVTPLMSDTTWNVSTLVPAEWKTPPYDPSGWGTAVAKRFPYPVVAPELSSGRTSWFER